MRKILKRWRDRRLRKWCIVQAINIHRKGEFLSGIADDIYKWIKSDGSDDQPFNFQKVLREQSDTIADLIAREG